MAAAGRNDPGRPRAGASGPSPRGGGRGRSLARYALSWIGVAVIVVVVAGGLIRAVRGEEDVTLPPVRAIELDDAAARAHCTVRRARRGERLNPPVDGPRTAERVRPGVYERPLATSTLGAAVRQGLVVIHHRPGLEGRVIDDLHDLQRALPQGTVVSVNTALAGSEVMVTAYMRLLACPRYTRDAVDAIRLFRGRFVGRGPDR